MAVVKMVAEHTLVSVEVSKTMSIRNSLLICFVTVCLWMTISTAEAASDVIEDIQVVVETKSGQVLPTKIKARMQASIYTISDNVLMGHPVQEIAENRMSYEKIVREVFERILMGYSVQQVTINPGVHTTIDVVVYPWQNTIENVILDVEVNGAATDVKNLILSDLSGLREVLDALLIGLPVDAVDWSHGVLKNTLNEELNARLPEYQAGFDINSGSTTTVKLLLYPQGEVIRDVNISLRSETIPNLLLLKFRPHMQEKAQNLIGLPVTFVQRHAAYFSDELSQHLNFDKNFRKFGIHADIKMEIANNSDIVVKADTDKYRISLEGYLDMGQEEDNTSLKLHTGKMISPRSEVFVETELLPHQMKWAFYPGLGYDVTPRLSVGLKYNTSEQENILWAKQKIAKSWLLRLEHTPRREFNEFALRYDLDELVGVEYVINDDDHWLRLVGYF